MSKLTWKYIHPFNDDGPIAKVEKIFETKLPEDFVCLIKEYNAGYPSMRVFEAGDAKSRVFSNLLSFDEKHDNNVFSTLILLREQGVDNILPFAEDPFGNFIGFLKEAEKLPIVFLELETNKTTYIADSISLFLEKLHE